MLLFKPFRVGKNKEVFSAPFDDHEQSTKTGAVNPPCPTFGLQPKNTVKTFKDPTRSIIDRGGSPTVPGFRFWPFQIFLSPLHGRRSIPATAPVMKCSRAGQGGNAMTPGPDTHRPGCSNLGKGSSKPRARPGSPRPAPTPALG